MCLESFLELVRSQTRMNQTEARFPLRAAEPVQLRFREQARMITKNPMNDTVSFAAAATMRPEVDGPQYKSGWATVQDRSGRGP